VLQEKANHFGALPDLGKDFNCSLSWIQRFKNRHIVFGKISGESAEVDIDVCTKWLENTWRTMRAGYNDDDIYNADEAGLFFKILPSKTLRFRNESCAGGKLSKERVTVLVAANMSGSEKRKLLVIGKSKKPRCFKGVTSFPVTYESNTKAWMTSELFQKISTSWDHELRSKRRKILLLLDNRPAHPHLDLKFIKLVFLPPNTTSVIQPMDQGVIRSQKAFYRKQLVFKIIDDLEKKIETKNTVLDAILVLSRAWDSVTPTTITNCYRHAKLSIIPVTNKSDEDTHFKDMESVLPMVNPDLTASDFVHIDDDLVTTETLSDEAIALSSVLKKKVMKNLEKCLQFQKPGQL